MGMENIVAVFNDALPHERSEGKAAYRTYHRLVGDIAERTGFTTEIGAAVFSALSPNNDYLGNLKDTHRLLVARARGASIDSFPVHTYGNNKRKAWDIAGGTPPLHLIVAPKTRSFFLNVFNPDDPAPVTIDGHMINLWEGVRRPLQSRNPEVRIAHVSPAMYETVAAAFRSLAKAIGLLPCELQATVWLAWRRRHGITKPQLHLFDVEQEAAGLGLIPAFQT